MTSEKTLPRKGLRPLDGDVDLELSCTYTRMQAYLETFRTCAEISPFLFYDFRSNNKLCLLLLFALSMQKHQLHVFVLTVTPET